MKLIHTSDWHLGRTLHGVDLLEHQRAHLAHLVELTRAERPAAVLVAGDVYDRAVPPVAAVERLEEALARLAELTLVVVTSGNHDSATRLGFGSALMRPEVRLVTDLDQVGQAIEVADPAGGPGALVYPLPFVDVFEAAARWGGEEAPLARSHEAVLGAAMARVRADLAARGWRCPGSAATPLADGGGPGRVSSGPPGGTPVGSPEAGPGVAAGGSLGEVRLGEEGGSAADGGPPARARYESPGQSRDGQPARPSGGGAVGPLDGLPGVDRPAVVVMAHAFVVGGQASESERDLTVCGVDSVPASVFAGADYVALGHLHGPQAVTGAPGQVLRYSGSPLAFSFSEAPHTKSTVVVTLGGDAGVVGTAAGKAGPGVATRLEPAPVPRPLAQVSGTIEELESPAMDHLAEAWLKVTVTDAARPDDMSARIRRRFPHVLQLEHAPAVGGETGGSVRVTRTTHPRDVVAQFVEYAGGAPATTAELAEVDSALAALTSGGAR
jgi:exonuclease SbcD